MADGELQIFVDKSIKQRLRENVKNPEDTEVNSVFYLYGETLQSKVYVVGCLACRRFITVPKNGYPAIPDWKNEQDELCCLIPNGLQLCGIYYCCVKETNLEASELERFYDGLSRKGDSGKQVVVQYCISSDGQKCFIYNKNLRSISECEYQEADILGEFWEQRICFRLQACIPVLVGKDERGSSPDVMNKIKKACQELSSVSSVFYIKDCNILLKNQDSERGEKETCDDLVMKMESSDQQGHSKGRGKQKSGKMSSSTNMTKIKNVLDVRFLNQLTATDENNKANHVPVIHFQKCISSQVKLNLSLDIVFYVSKETLLTSLPDLFTSAMTNQLRRMGSVIKEFSKDGVSLSVPNVCHFKPPGFCHLVTAVYPNVDDEQLVPFRLELHKRLLLPQNRPFLRSSNKYLFNNEQQQGIYLTNPHAGLTGGFCGTVAVVEGTYTYHHYMQDNFNDDGWGCAYRSLQTIVSWFRHQGYTSNPVPSHREIQQALVDLQDKTEKFVGSRQWIGSFEVSMCLEHLLGVTSKIMFVNSGAEMRSKGRDLLHHFQTQGTPVMIGGGVLAHTILGVDFNDQTGDIRFLILDPHYTGGEDLKVILDKGWCGWKGADFWNQQVYYNMCMPQRPDMI